MGNCIYCPLCSEVMLIDSYRIPDDKLDNYAYVCNNCGIEFQFTFDDEKAVEEYVKKIKI